MGESRVHCLPLFGMHSAHVARNDCVASDVNMTLSGAPAFDKSGDLIFRSLQDQLKEDKAHDLLTLNRQRAVTLTDESFAAFSKLLKAKKLRKRPRMTTTLRQDGIQFAIERKEARKFVTNLIGVIGKEATKVQRAQAKSQSQKKLPGTVRKPTSSAKKPASSSTSVSKPSLKRKRELGDHDKEQENPR